MLWFQRSHIRSTYYYCEMVSVTFSPESEVRRKRKHSLNKSYPNLIRIELNTIPKAPIK